MRAAGKVTALFPERTVRSPRTSSITASPRLPRRRTRSTVCVTAPICARARSFRRESERVTDRYDDGRTTSPSASMSRRTLQLDPRQRSPRRMARLAFVGNVHRSCFIPNSIAARLIIDPTRFVADPDKAQTIPRTALRHGAPRLCRLRSLQRRYRSCQCSPRAPRFLSQGVPAGTAGRAAAVSRPDQAGRTDGRQTIRRSATGCSSAFRSCVRAPSSGGCCSTRSGERQASSRGVVNCLCARLDRLEFLKRPNRGAVGGQPGPVYRPQPLDVLGEAPFAPRKPQIR